MSARWIKQNLGLLLFSVGFVAVLSLLLWMHRQATTRQQFVESALNSQQLHLKQLQSIDPYPSQENIQIVRGDHDKLQKIFSTLQQTLVQKALQPPKATNDIEFAQSLRKTVDALETLAQKGGLVVPADFKFGFSRYATTLPCRNPSGKIEDCLELLAKQLAVIEQVTTLLVSNGVDQLDYIHRTEAEPGASGDALNVPLTQNPKALFSVLPFELQLSGTTEALQKFINSLTQTDGFFTIRNLKFEAIPSSKPGEPRRLTVTMRFDVIEFPQFAPRTGRPNPRAP